MTSWSRSRRLSSPRCSADPEKPPLTRATSGSHCSLRSGRPALPGGNKGNIVGSFARRVAAFGVVGVLMASGCSESSTESSAETTAKGGTTTVVSGVVQPKPGDGTSIVSRYAGADWFDGTVADTPRKADPSLSPVKVGVMSADSGAIAALPELHQGTDAAIGFINEELGGVDGHPIEAVFCEVDLSPEKSQLCARKMVEEKVVAVLSGIDIAAGDAVKVLNENDIPWVGGIPVTDDEMKSPNTFQFSGGTPGAFVAMADHAANQLKAKTVSVMYLNIPQVKDAAVQYGVGLLKKQGVTVNEVGFDLTTQDYAAVAQKAAETNPDAIVAAAADSGCAKVLQAISDLQSKAQIYMVGSCADKKWLDQVGTDKAKGTIFSIENRLDQSDGLADTEIFTEALAKYQPATAPVGAATVSFKGAMNLWAVLHRIGPKATPQQIAAAFKAAKKAPSFDGHDYTCDGQQIPGSPGLCAPQEVLIRLKPDGGFEEASKGWIDVPRIVADNNL